MQNFTNFRWKSVDKQFVKVYQYLWLLQSFAGFFSFCRFCKLLFIFKLVAVNYSTLLLATLICLASFLLSLSDSFTCVCRLVTLLVQTFICCLNPFSKLSFLVTLVWSCFSCLANFCSSISLFFLSGLPLVIPIIAPDHPNAYKVH